MYGFGFGLDLAAYFMWKFVNLFCVFPLLCQILCLSITGLYGLSAHFFYLLYIILHAYGICFATTNLKIGFQLPYVDGCLLSASCE